jgi:hypothetical protein
MFAKNVYDLLFFLLVFLFPPEVICIENSVPKIWLRVVSTKERSSVLRLHPFRAPQLYAQFPDDSSTWVMDVSYIRVPQRFRKAFVLFYRWRQRIFHFLCSFSFFARCGLKCVVRMRRGTCMLSAFVVCTEHASSPETSPMCMDNTTMELSFSRGVFNQHDSSDYSRLIFDQ